MLESILVDFGLQFGGFWIPMPTTTEAAAAAAAAATTPASSRNNSNTSNNQAMFEQDSMRL